MDKTRLAAALCLCALAGAAHAQSGVTVYGSLDQYLSYLYSSSGTHATALEDGSTLRTRLGFRGQEDLGAGLQARFQLEMGISGQSGAPADAGRAFDRQSWVGLASPSWGEVRVGRQNSVVFNRGDYIDFGSRTLGSVVNAFGTPSRYDRDLAYIAPRIGGVLVEAHYALAGTTNGVTDQAVYQLGVDYLTGPVRVGYAGIAGRPPAGAPVRQDARYDNLYANYDYGKGRIYAVYIRSNNNVSSGALANGGSVLGNVGALVAGTSAEASRFYRVGQLSADYRVNARLRVGGLVGQIRDTSGNGKNANGFALGGYYDLSKRTTLVGLFHELKNAAAAGFRPSGSAGIASNFTAAADVNGRTISGLALGIVHRF